MIAVSVRAEPAITSFLAGRSQRQAAITPFVNTVGRTPRPAPPILAGVLWAACRRTVRAAETRRGDVGLYRFLLPGLTGGIAASSGGSRSAG